MYIGSSNGEGSSVAWVTEECGVWPWPSWASWPRDARVTLERQHAWFMSCFMCFKWRYHRHGERETCDMYRPYTPDSPSCVSLTLHTCSWKCWVAHPYTPAPARCSTSSHIHLFLAGVWWTTDTLFHADVRWIPNTCLNRCRLQVLTHLLCWM